MSDVKEDSLASDSDQDLNKALRLRLRRPASGGLHGEYAESDDVKADDISSTAGNPRKRSRKTALQNPGRSAPAKAVDSSAIPRSFSEFSEADTAMWNMRKSGKGWEEIRTEWERLTGQKPARTTLPNRFVRIRDKIGDFSNLDDELLLRCKRELEHTFAAEIWAMVSEAMIAKGGNKFSAAAIKKRHGQLAQTSPEQAIGGADEEDDEA